MVGGAATPPVTCAKDGQDWVIGGAADVEWIERFTRSGLEITSAIPPVFEAYATIVVPEDPHDQPDDYLLILDVVGGRPPDQPWWLGFLDTGAADVVFPDAPRVTLYAGWSYVLVQAGKDQASRWRKDWPNWRRGPDLIFPLDRSWLLSWLWDDDWLCFGGPARLLDDLLKEQRLEVRRVGLGEDATPPGHVAI